jgi:hypothetical protein
VTVLALLATLVAAEPTSEAVTRRCSTAAARYLWSDSADRGARNHGPVGDYYADAGLWAAAGSDYHSRMVVCSPGRWEVTARVTDGGSRSVKAYPNVHMDFLDWNSGQAPRVSDFTRIRASYRANAARVGTYNVAFDIWLNGIGPGAHELMIWTENRGQTPAGEPVGHMRFAKRRWTLWKGSVSGIEYLALVPNRALSSGRLPLLEVMNRLIRTGHLPASSTLAQIGFGVEIVSTDGRPAVFRVSKFRVQAERG